MSNGIMTGVGKISKFNALADSLNFQHGLHGLGDTSSCGDNPCGVSDYLLGPFQQCADYLACISSDAAKETASSVLTGGIPAQTIAYGTGAAATGVLQYGSQLGGEAMQNFVAGATGATPGGVTNSLLSLALIAGVVVVGVSFLKGFATARS